MVRVRCPQCQTTFGVVGRPVCPTCGFTGTNPAAASGGWVPVGGPGEAPAVGPEASPMTSEEAPPRRSRAWIVILVILLLLLGAAAAYYYLYGNPLAESRVTEQEMRASLNQVTADMGDPTPSRAIGVEGTLRGVFGGADEGFGFPFPGDVAFRIRVLNDPDAQAYEFSVSADGPMPFGFAMKQKGKIINALTGDQTLVGRDEDPTTLQDQDLDLEGETFRLEDLEGFAISSTERERIDGRWTTKFTGTAEGATVLVWVDERTKEVVQFRFTGPEGTGEGEFQILRGNDVRISVTETGKRLPLQFPDEQRGESQSGGPTFINGTIGSEHAMEVKLSEVELRAVRGSAEPYTVLLSMRADEGTKTGANQTLSFTDVDQDGLVSAGDTYRLVTPSAGPSTAHLEFYDLWAQGYANDAEMPGFGFLAAGLALGLFVLRRKT